MSFWANKVALVTGGSAGLGRAIADAFAAAGLRLTIAARDEARLNEAAAQLRARGAEVLDIRADVTRQEGVDALVLQTVEKYGRLDVLVNNVGRSARGKILDMTAEDFRAALELNFLTAVRMTRAAAPHLLATKGHVVYIGSLAAKSASRFLGTYPASKFPLAAYSQQLRLELAPEGVHVLLVCPGPIQREDANTRYADQAAGLPDSARRPGGGVKVKAIPPDDLARRILRACERRQPELVIPSKARWLFALAQLWPGLADSILLRSTSGNPERAHREST
jgi:short-subunit dehydrogenase